MKNERFQLNRRSLASLALTLLLLMLCCTEVMAKEVVKRALDANERVESNENGEAILQRARNLYEYGDYDKVVKLLERALSVGKFDESQIAAVHELAGICSFILQNKTKAREHFLQLLMRAPDTKLDPLYVPPIIIDFFEEVRKENREMLEAIRAHLARQKQERERQERMANMAVKVKNPYFVNFIPFGAGQFQNEEQIKGGLFLSGEALLLSLNIAAYFVSDGLKGKDGRYSAADAEDARSWRIVQYSAMGALVLVAVGGVIDAVLNWQEYDEAEKPLKPETKNLPANEEKVLEDVEKESLPSVEEPNEMKR